MRDTRAVSVERGGSEDMGRRKRAIRGEASLERDCDGGSEGIGGKSVAIGRSTKKIRPQAIGRQAGDPPHIYDANRVEAELMRLRFHVGVWRSRGSMTAKSETEGEVSKSGG